MRMIKFQTRIEQEKMEKAVSIANRMGLSLAAYIRMVLSIAIEEDAKK